MLPRRTHTHTHRIQNTANRSACHWWFRYLPHNLHIFIACVLFTPCPKTLARSFALFPWLLFAVVAIFLISCRLLCGIFMFCNFYYYILCCSRLSRALSAPFHAAGCFHHRVDLIAKRVPFYGHPKGMLWAFYALQLDMMMGASHLIPLAKGLICNHMKILNIQSHTVTI